MKKMILLVLCLIVPTLHADEAVKNQKLESLIQIMDMDSMVDSMYGHIEQVMQNMSTEYGITPAEQPLFDEYYNKMILILKSDMSWSKMKPQMMEIYAKNFSEKEIEDMLAFYQTPSGQSVIKKMPVVMQESMQMSQGLAMQVMPKLKSIAEDLKQDLDKHRNKSEH